MGPKPSGPSFRRYVNQSGERDPHELISTRLPTPGGPGPGPGPGSVSQAGNLPEGFTATFTSRYIDTGQLRLHAVIGGDGPPLLLVHGWPETWYAWRLVMPALARDYQVVAVDQRAIGLSDKPQDGYDTGTQAGDMVALMDALGHQRFAMIDAARALELGGGPGSLELAGWAAYSKRGYELAVRRAEEATERPMTRGCAPAASP